MGSQTCLIRQGPAAINAATLERKCPPLSIHFAHSSGLTTCSDWLVVASVKRRAAKVKIAPESHLGSSVLHHGCKLSVATRLSCASFDTPKKGHRARANSHFTPRSATGGSNPLQTAPPPDSIAAALLEPIDPSLPRNPHPSLINEDFQPTMPEGRILSVWDLTSLWIGLVVAVPNYFLAGSLVEMGMAWWQGVVTVFCANLLVLVPMVLNGHPGTKYGIPFPVLSRASFGIRGTNIPSLLRGLVACGWFGIQTWVGGQAIYTLANACLGGTLVRPIHPWLGTSVPELASFFAFWTLQVAIVWNGIESIRELEKYAAPVLILMCAALLMWACARAGGFGSMLSTPSQFIPGGAKEGQFWSVFFPSLTANVGAWATLSLNIPDFTRYAHSQRDQLTGQALGLPLFMAAFTFVGLAVTSATVVIFGEAISDPIALLGRIEGVLPIALSLVGLTLATLTTNIAFERVGNGVLVVGREMKKQWPHSRGPSDGLYENALTCEVGAWANVVAPANALVNLDPTRFSFRAGGVLTAILGFILAPWRLISNTQGFIYTWLIGYSALLGPVGGIVITDYYLLRRRKLNVDALYTYGPESEYWYQGGYNGAALAALAMGVLPNVPGFLHAAGIMKSMPSVWKTVYNNAWFVGFATAAFLYYYLMRSRRDSPVIAAA